MIKKLCLLLLVLSSYSAQAEFINIGIFASKKVTSFEFSVRAGKYVIYTEQGKLKDLNSKAKLSVRYVDGKIQLKEQGTILGNFNKVNLMGIGWYNHFLIKGNSPISLERRYDDNLKVVAQRNEMTIVNNIDLDNYVAGVVEAEVGRRPPKEYFKLQAIICRTYALSNTQKHLVDGYNLCDEVHCQAYHGKTFYAPIVEAAMQTRGAVIVDSDIQLITAAFHSNCGGQTVNSEDVWSKSVYYLRSVNDTFCLDKRNAVWQKEISRSSWNAYLTAHLPPVIRDTAFNNFKPTYRQTFVPASDLSFEDIRNKFRLRSTFFGASTDGNQVVLRGKGYGHGVGLCQEGAMEMAALGYNYSKILHFYYSGVHIIDLSAIDFFKED
ncbi:MAG: SpoIID/LytB domain-containing protein [Vicingaceae bacterium]